MGIQIPRGMDNFSVGVPPVILTTYFTHHIGVLKRATECAAGAAIIGGTRPPNILVGGDANVNVSPTNCPFSYFVDICLMFASQIQLKIINFFVC